MARSKLTDRDREQLVELYRNTEATLQALADQFSVSYSTASRIAKEGIPKDEYQALVKTKRSGGERKSVKKSPPARSLDATQPSLLDPLPSEDTHSDDGVAEESIATGSEAGIAFEPLDSEPAEETSESAAADAEWEDPEIGDPDDLDDFDEDRDTEASDEEASIAAELMEDEDDDEDDIEATLDDDSDDDDEDDDEEFEEDSHDLEESDFEPDEPQTADLSVRELEDLELPQRIYAVVDRFQELSAAPLADFKHLGVIPDELASANTLPLFDEHRVARRFADRSKRYGRNKNRPIAFPGHYVWVTRTQLRAKGIEYLLYDGQVYAL